MRGWIGRRRRRPAAAAAGRRRGGRPAAVPAAAELPVVEGGDQRAELDAGVGI